MSDLPDDFACVCPRTRGRQLKGTPDFKCLSHDASRPPHHLVGEVLPPSARWSAVARVLVEASSPLRRSRPQIEMHLHRMTCNVSPHISRSLSWHGMFDPVLRYLETHLHTQASFQSSTVYGHVRTSISKIKIGEHTVQDDDHTVIGMI